MNPVEPMVLRSLQRWLLAVQFVGSATDASSRGTPADHTAAVILADTAVESLLGLIGSLPGGNLKGREDFSDLRNAAFRVLAERSVRPPPGLSASLLSVHLARNNAVHHGIEVVESETAIDNAHRLLSLLSKVTADFPDIPAAAGLLVAVAALVAPATEVADYLRTADIRMSSRDWAGACDAGSLAFSEALRQSTPNIPRTPTFGARLPRELATVAANILDSVNGRLERLEAWVVPVAVGLRPSEYRAMRATLGDVQSYFDRSEVVRVSPPTESEARRALDLLAEVIVRLWASGTMFHGNASAAFEAERKRREGWEQKP